MRPSTAGEQHDADHRQEQHRRRPGVGQAEHEAGDDAEDDPGGHVDDAVDELGHVLDVVAEVGQRLAGRPDRLSGLGTAAGHLGGEQVGRAGASACAPRTSST